MRYAQAKESVTALKILVFSDSHGLLGYLYDAIEAEMPDVVLHLGDHLRDAEAIEAAFDRPEFYMVAGNCDYDAAGQTERLLELDGVRIFMTHGHRYGVKMRLDSLCARAESLGAQLALFGHTHQPLLEQRGGLWLLNPGAGGYGWIETRQGSFTCRLKKE